mgnify:CR=1 FL=1
MTLWLLLCVLLMLLGVTGTGTAQISRGTEIAGIIDVHFHVGPATVAGRRGAHGGSDNESYVNWGGLIRPIGTDRSVHEPATSVRRPSMGGSAATSTSDSAVWNTTLPSSGPFVHDGQQSSGEHDP